MVSKVKKVILLAVLLIVHITLIPKASQAATTYSNTIPFIEGIRPISDDTPNGMYTALMNGKKIIITVRKKDRLKADILFNKLKIKVNKKNFTGVEFSEDLYKVSKIKSGYKYTISKENSEKYQKATLSRIDNISESTEELAQKIHNTLYGRKAYAIYVKGEFNNIIDDLICKVQKVNNQGVLFKYSKTKIGNEGCIIRIKENQAETYYYMISLCEKVLAYSKEKLNFMIYDILSRYYYDYYNDYDDEKFENYEEYRNFVYNSEYSIYFDEYDASYSYCDEFFNHDYDYYDEKYFDDYRKDDFIQNKLITNASGMYELSPIMKVQTLSMSGCFACNGDVPESGFGMVYQLDGEIPDSDAEILKSLCNATARGRCQLFAICEEVVFSNWGINAEMVTSWDANKDYYFQDDHAWTEGVAVNADGIAVKFIFDYGLKINEDYASFSMIY